MKLTRERALELHRQMWSDMQRDLGDKPVGALRIEYKGWWCHKHFPIEHIDNHCFLCEYTDSCRRCPIEWPNEAERNSCFCMRNGYYYEAPISEILALPEREEKE